MAATARRHVVVFVCPADSNGPITRKAHIVVGQSIAGSTIEPSGRWLLPRYEVVPMSRSETARLARSSTGWFLLFLCTSLLAWRISSRIEQYHPSSAGPPAAVAFFDANERNTASLDVAQSQQRFVAEEHHQLFCLDSPEVLPLLLTDRRQPDTSTVLPDILLSSVSLFSNPPPRSLA